MTDVRTDGASGRKTRLFVSYSRADKDFVDRLAQALQERGLEPFVDRRDIPDLDIWWERIEDLITRTDSVLYIISPDAIASAYTLKEVKFAAQLNKRLAPVLYRSVKDREVPDEIGRVNYIDFVGQPFEAATDRLIHALETDLVWIRKHTELCEGSRLWDAAGRPGPGGLLLRPPPLTQAEAWISLRPRSMPEPAAAISAFIAASRAAFDQEEADKKAAVDRLLIAESRRLARLADECTRVGDGATAMALAIEALPDDSARLERPYVPEAETALLMARARLQELQVADRGDPRKIAEFTPGPRWNVRAAEGLVILTDIAAERSTTVDLRRDDPRVDLAVVSPNGQRLFIAALDHAPCVFDIPADRFVTTLKEEHSPYPVSHAAFSNDGRRIVTASGGQTAMLWDAETGVPIATLTGHSGTIRALGFNHRGDRLVTASDDATVRVWDTTTLQTVGLLAGHSGGVRSAAFSPDDRTILTQSDDETMRVWQAEPAPWVRVFRPEGPPDLIVDVALSRDGRRLLTCSNTARIFDLASGDMTELDNSAGTRYGTFSLDGAQVILTCPDGKRRTLDARTGALISVVDGPPPDFPLRSGVSPDGSRMALASRVPIGRALDGDVKEAVSPPITPVNIVDAATKAELKVLIGHTDGVYCTAFSPDGRRLVTASDDKTARVWDLATGRTILVLSGHQERVRSAVFSPDGRRVATGSFDGTARVWDLASTTTQELTAECKRLLPRCLTPEQREQAFLEPEPPAWCIEMAKWPYHTRDWEERLKFKRANANQPSPTHFS